MVLKISNQNYFKNTLNLLFSSAGAALCGQASAALWLVWATLKFEPC